MAESPVSALLAIEDNSLREQWVRDHRAAIDESLVEALKNEAIRLRMVDTQAALAIARLLQTIYMHTGVVRHRGYGLWAEAVVRSLGLGEYEAALRAYDEAISIFENEGDDLSPALMQISRLWSLANLNRHAEAFAAGEAAAAVLAAHERWLPSATLHLNVANVYTRLGEYGRALTMFETAQRAYESFGLEDKEVEGLWALAVHNRAISLCFLGRFEESIEASQTAYATQERLGNRLEAARVQHHLALTYFILGRYNESLRLFYAVRDLFAADGLQRHTARADLDICECLLRLRRFDRAREKISAVRAAFESIGAQHEQGMALLYEAMALEGSGNPTLALDTLAKARGVFEQEENRAWQGNCDLETGQIMSRQARYAECLVWANAATEKFRAESMRVREAEAMVLAAQAQARLGERDAAFELIESVRRIGEGENMPLLLFQIHYLLGQLARAEAHPEQAFVELQQAIGAVERLRAHLMIDLRVNFQEDKQTLYEDMVAVCLELRQPETALHYADRAKSRTLLELIDYRVQMRLHTRQAADQPMVDQLLKLRARRDQLCRYGENQSKAMERSANTRTADGDQAEIARLETQIAELWDELLIRNADYAEDSDLWLLSEHPLGLTTPDDTALVEYFSLHGRLVVFVVQCGEVQAYQLPAEFTDVRRLVERVHWHLRNVHRFPPEQLPNLTGQVQHLLHQLYAALFAPIEAVVESCRRLIIVPHGALHYAPFHAFYDGSKYLVERFDISYLPNAALLRAHSSSNAAGAGVLALGYSAGNSLPYVVEEAEAIAGLFGGEALVEERAARQDVASLVGNKQIVHLAAHAEYNEDQPLFSGLLLAGGWLTTLDVFNLELKADLVTLSACKTGRNVLGGGDELLGLMRAFLFAGAASLVMSMWSVEDRSTAAFMRSFYGHLQRGRSKAEALALAQRQFVTGEPGDGASGQPDYRHPYFWAPFFLVGDSAAIMPLS